MNTFRQFILFVIFYDHIVEVVPVTNVTGVTCDYNPKKCSGGHCKISSSRGAMKYINAGCYVFEPLDNLKVHMALLRKNQNTYLPAIDPIDQDLCDLENGKFENYFLSRIISLNAKKLGFKCPLKGNISFERIPLFMHFAQGFFPVGDYMLLNKVDQKGEYVAALNLSFAIKQKDFF